MTAHIFPPPPTVDLPIAGDDRRFPVRRVFCVGRNYEAHAKEMGTEVDREAPFYFTKARDMVQESGATQPYPPGTSNYHYEMELVVALGAPVFQGSTDTALDAVFGYACGLDMTRRDLQQKGKDKGRPWDLGKDVENSAVMAPIVPVATVGHPTTGRIFLEVDGTVKQDSDLDQLIWSVPEIIADLSKFYHLQPGDLIYTGTPAGVGAVGPGAVLHGGIDGLGTIDLKIAA